MGVTYTAQWIESDWNFELDSSDNTYKLTEYIGTSKDIVVPNEIAGKQTKIDLSSAFRLVNLEGPQNWKQVTSVRFSNVNGKKVKAIGERIWFVDWSNMITFDGSGLDTTNVSTMEQAFYECNKLTTINLSGWNTSNVTSMKNMFYSCYSLSNLNLTSFDTSNVTDMSGMFYNCSGLNKIDVSRFNTSNVTNMSRMFEACYSLSDISVGNFDVSRVTNMEKMFADNPNLTYLDLRNFVINKNCTLLNMFEMPTKTRLLVISNDPKLQDANYDYALDNRVPSGPTFKANGGVFSNQKEQLTYFDNCAIKPDDEKLQPETLEKYKETLIPIRENYAFRGWMKEEKNKKESKVISIIDQLDDSYVANWISDRVNTTMDGTVNKSVGLLGIAYQPTQFTIGRTQLNESGPQTIEIPAKEGFHIGVKDHTQKAIPWTLSARLEWVGKVIPGATIKTTNETGTVMNNTNDGTSPFDASRDLKEINEEVVGEKNVEIGTTNTQIMQAKSDKTHDAIYDYDFGNVSLDIPEVGEVPGDVYSGNVCWELTNAPE